MLSLSLLSLFGTLSLVSPAQVHASLLAADTPLPSARLVHAADAPLGGWSAFAASAMTTATGVALMAAGTVQLTRAQPTATDVQSFFMLSLGFLAFNFGPDMADALNGDWVRMLSMGGGRLLLVFSSALLVVAGPVGALLTVLGFCGFLGWVLFDVVNSYRADERWAARKNGAATPFTYRF